MPSNKISYPSDRPLTAVGAFVLCMVAIVTMAGCGKPERAATPQVPEVEVAEVAQQDVPIYEEWVAQLNGPINAEITPKVQGYVLKQSYVNGYFVKKGQLLFELDSRQYEAEVEQAKAQLAKAEANLERFQNDVARDTPLAAQNAIPQKQLESDIASVNATRAQVQAERAALDNAQLNLGWTKIYSPVDGIAGDAKSQVGDLVGTNTKMATVSQVDPIWANFNISEAAYLGNAGKISDLLRSGKSKVPLKVEYIQANEEKYPHVGRIIQINRQVTSGTGTIQLTAELPNRDATLRPGGFGRVRMQTSDNKNALLIPQPAVMEVQGQYQVVVVSADNKATFRPVKMGQRFGTNWIVREGLQPNERVVVEGLLKIQQAAAAATPEVTKTGIPVTPKPYAAATSVAQAETGVN